MNLTTHDPLSGVPLLTSAHQAALNAHPDARANEGVRQGVIGLMAQGQPFEAALEAQLAFLEQRRQTWLKTAVIPYAERHGLTVRQALSVLYEDEIVPGPTARDVYTWVSEGNTFHRMTVSALEGAESPAVGATAKRTSGPQP